MSRSVRLKEHLAAEVERLAKEERRSLAQMVELLLEQALRMDNETIVPATMRKTDGTDAIEGYTSPAAVRRMSDPHFKPDPKR